jgi:glycoprotein 3-alpha-L-fucosyltransferase
LLTAQILQKYLPIDIMGGSCATVPFISQCSKSHYNQDDCFAALGRKYKFYLAIENNDCSDYITEKVWHHCFGHNMVPLVSVCVMLWMTESVGVGQVCQLHIQPS